MNKLRNNICLFVNRLVSICDYIILRLIVAGLRLQSKTLRITDRLQSISSININHSTNKYLWH